MTSQKPAAKETRQGSKHTITIIYINYSCSYLLCKLVLQSSMSRPHYITALLKSSIKDVRILQTGTDDQGDIFGQLLSVLNNNGPLDGAGIVFKDELDEGKLTLVTR